MKKIIAPLLTFCFFALSFNTNAQTYFFLNNISITPINATIGDPIKINIDGFKSDPCSYLSDFEIAQNGTTISFVMNWSNFAANDPDIACSTVLENFDTTFCIDPLPAGNYNVVFSGPNYDFLSVEGSTSFNVVEPNSISSLSNLGIKIYPNPAKDRLYFDEMTTTIDQLSICDVNGRIVLNQFYLPSGIDQIDISKLQFGYYYLVLEKDGKQYTQSFQKAN